MDFLKNQKDLFNSKNIAWSSGWTNILSKYHFSNDYQKAWKWLWFLNVLTIYHYKWDEKWKQLLENMKLNLPIYTIKENNYDNINK